VLFCTQAPFGHDSNDALANQLGIFKVTTDPTQQSAFDASSS